MLKYVIKSILMHEYQHKSTRINTSPTWVNTSPTRVKTNQHESDKSQHESTQVQHESTRDNNSQLDHKIIIVYVF